MAKPFAEFFTSLSNQQQAEDTFPGRHLAADIDRLQGERDALAPQRARHIGSVGSARQRLSARLGRDATMRVAQQDQATPTSFRGALDQATRRMRARQGIVNRGDAAIRNQSLRDRIQVARGSVSRRGSLHNMLSGAQQIREGVNVGIANANQRIAESNANLFGTLAGAATSYMKGRTKKPGEISQGVDEGTAAADYLNTNGPTYNYSDPFAASPIVGA